MNTTAIIVNYYTSHFLPPLLEILDNDPLINSIIVVDNSRESGLPEILKKYRKTRMISFPQNVGFAAAINQVAKRVNSDWLLVVNPDTLPDHDCVEKLLSGAEKTNALIAGPRFYWDEMKIFRLPPALGYSWWTHVGMDSSSKFELDARLLYFYWNIRFERFWNETEPFFEPFLSGACMLIRNDKNFFRSARIFDERFFLYYEDTDLCVRAVADYKPVICVPGANMIHYWDQSPSVRKSSLMTESGNKFWEKYYVDPIPTINAKVITPFEIVNLGKINESPFFHFETEINTKQMIFEFGVNHFFVPNAQAIVSGETFNFPKPIWDRLPSGTYLTRLREYFLNRTIMLWKWTKA